jgi:hypothetical protein
VIAVKLLPLVLALATAFPAVARAQAIYRCDAGSGNVSYQQTACVTPTHDAPFGAILPVLAEPASPTDAEIGQPSARRDRAREESVAIAARVLVRQEGTNQRAALQHAENRGRCVEALRVAHLCGKNAGTFYCDSQGFQAIPVAAREKTAALGNGERYRMEQCARDARASRP